ncbi:MAG TPA: hypothetical protein VFM73_04580 [Xanthomonadaceae bacterium]|nr:hypothetical protein [Xanthomonadaceae bacterium]
MGRTVLGVLAGLAAMIAVITLVQWGGAQLFPPPPGIDMRDPDALATVMAQMPLGALAFVVVAWLLGAFAGGWVAARISVQYPRVAAAIVALAVVAGVVMMILAFPHPLWMTIAGLVLPVPLALAGARLARPRATPSL